MASGGINFANIRPVQAAASKPINFANIKPVAPAAPVDPNAFDVDSFTDELGRTEGTKAHKSLEGGKATGAFGIKFTKGLTKAKGEDDRSFAKRVVQVHEGEVVKKVGQAQWDAIPKTVKTAVMDLKYNFGIGSGVANGIKGGSDAKSIRTIMENTLDTAGSKMTSSNTKIAVPGLAKRRAEKWNLVYPNEKITKVELRRIGKSTKVAYLNSKGAEVFSYNTTRVISSDFKTEVKQADIDVK